MEQKKLFVVIAILILIGGIVVGFVLGAGSGRSSASSQIQKLQTQIERAKKFFPALPSETKSISGMVKDVNAGEHIVSIETSMTGPFDESPVARKIMISTDTKITRVESKDPAVYQREIADFQKAVLAQSGKPGSHPLVPPEPFRDVAATIADLHTGVRIIVTAGENIGNKESFTATAIRILDVPGAKGSSGAPVHEP